MCSYLNEALKLCLFLFCGNVFCRKIIKHQISMHMVMTIMTKSLFSLLSLHEIETKDYFGKEISKRKKNMMDFFDIVISKHFQ